MTSQTSYNSLGKNVRDELHRMRSAILLLGVLYLVLGPVWLMLTMTTYDSFASLSMLTQLFLIYFEPFYFAALAVGSIGGLYVTRYQNVPQQSNFYHSLPITREGLLSARVLALVFVQLLLLLAVTAVNIVVVLMTASHVSSALATNLILAAGIHFCYIMLIFLLALAVTLFAGQLTANTIGQVLMTVVLHVSVPVFGTICMGLNQSFFHTIGEVGILEHLTRFNILTGFMAMITSTSDHLSALNPALVQAEDAANFAPSLIAWPLVTTLVHVVLTVLLFAATYALYKRRAVEKAGDTLLFPVVGSVIKGIYVFFGGVVCGVFFWQIVDNVYVGFILGAVLAMIIVHLVAEMIYSMDVDGVRRNYLVSIIGMVVTLAVTFGLNSGVIDLDHRLPDTASVKGASISYSNVGDFSMNVNDAAATDPDTIAKVMDAARQLQEKNIVVEPDPDGEYIETVSINLAYDTAFGKSTRLFTVPADEGRAIMQPLFDDGNVNSAIWSSLADAKVEDLLEFSISPAFSDLVGGEATYLIESNSAYSGHFGEGSLVKDSEDGARRAEELLQAIQKDLAQRDRSVLESRVIANIGYGVLDRNEYGEAHSYWSSTFEIYAGDKACAALIDEWRAEGFLPDEATQLKGMLSGFEAIVYDPAADDRTTAVESAEAEASAEDAESLDVVNLSDENTTILDSDRFVDLYLSGDLVSDMQCLYYGTPAQKNVAVGLCNGTVADDESSIVSVYYLREGAQPLA